MNNKYLETSLKVLFLILTALIFADMVNTFGKEKMQLFPVFTPPQKIKKQIVPVEAAPEVEEESVPEPLGLPLFKLLGTITGAYPYAVILDPASNKQEIYRLNTEIGGWLIHEIGKNRVVLKKDNLREIIEVVFIEGQQAAAGLKSAPTGKGLRLDPRDVEGALSDMNTVMTQARVTPNVDGGKTTGYKIFNIAPGSIYTKLGIQNNDIVERVNGVDINNPDTLYKLFQQIKSERKITLDFSRGGRKESVNIEIR